MSSEATATSEWSKSAFSYVKDGNALQTVDVWVPNQASHQARFWLIYIHGGAWRDPMVDSSSFTQPVNHTVAMESAVTNKIAGFASINYSLSPHPGHPDDPAPVPGPGVKAIPSRSAKHPDHIIDVLRGIHLLDSTFKFGNDYILAGHSCGATLAFQVAMDRKLWLRTHPQASDLITVPKPVAILGLNGLYDLPRLILEPGKGHEHMAKEYENFVRLAFGDDKNVWTNVSPTSVTNWPEAWPEGKLAILTQSHQDSLVNYSQTEFMFENLRHSAGGAIDVGETECSGDHNDLWKKGDRLAAIMVDALKKLD